jgi:hypothetical protein
MVIAINRNAGGLPVDPRKCSGRQGIPDDTKYSARTNNGQLMRILESAV